MKTQRNKGNKNKDLEKYMEYFKTHTHTHTHTRHPEGKMRGEIEAIVEDLMFLIISKFFRDNKS